MATANKSLPLLSLKVIDAQKSQIDLWPSILKPPYLALFPHCDPEDQSNECCGVSISHESAAATPRRILFPLFNMLAIVVCPCVRLKICLNRAQSQNKMARAKRRKSRKGQEHLAGSCGGQIENSFLVCCCWCCCCCGIVANFKASCELWVAAGQLAAAFSWFSELGSLTFWPWPFAARAVSFIKTRININ